MKYSITFGPRAEKFFHKTKDAVVAKRIFKKIESLGKDARPEDSKLIHGSDYLRVRVGDYRIVYKVDDGDFRVVIAMIGHRRDVYEKLFR